MSLPPGPRQPGVAQILQWALRPIPFMESCASRFGDAFTLRWPGLAPGPVVFVSSPELIKQVFTADANVLRAGEANDILLPLLGHNSLLLLDGVEHLRQRKLMLPPFHGERMQAYAEIMRDVTEATVDAWPRNRPFALHPFMQSITLEIIMRSVFGVDEKHLGELLVEYVTPPPAILTFVPPWLMQRDFPGSPWRLLLKRRARVDAEVFRLIDERRRANENRPDVLSLLLSARDEAGQPMTNQELRDELLTLLLAGHETTATGLAWAFERLLAEPAILRKLDEELQRVTGSGPLRPEHLPALEYADAVLRETLRMRPIIPIVLRRVAAPWKLGAWELPAGVTIAPCIWLAQRRPEIYADPERFVPERWLGQKTDPYSWLPFGGGVRRCIGMAFALYEMKIVLATVLKRARLRLDGNAPLKVVRRSITFAPDGGTRVIAA